MKYLDSWIISVSKPKFNLDHSHYLKWGVAIVYTVTLLILMVVTIATYAQFGQEDYKNWNLNINKHTRVANKVFWNIIVITSTVITVTSIVALSITVRKLRAASNYIALNIKSMTSHSVLLVLQCIGVVVFSFKER